MLNLKNKDNGAIFTLMRDRAETLIADLNGDKQAQGYANEILRFVNTLESRESIQSIINRKD